LLTHGLRYWLYSGAASRLVKAGPLTLFSLCLCVSVVNRILGHTHKTKRPGLG